MKANELIFPFFIDKKWVKVKDSFGLQKAFMLWLKRPPIRLTGNLDPTLFDLLAFDVVFSPDGWICSSDVKIEFSAKDIQLLTRCFKKAAGKYYVACPARKTCKRKSLVSVSLLETLGVNPLEIDQVLIVPEVI